MIHRNTLVRSSVLAVRVASVANMIFLAAALAGLAASWLFAGQFTAMLLGEGTGPDVASRVIGGRWMLLLGVAMAAAIFVLLRALGEMVATVAAGDPFIEANAGRLRRIGWALLALQLLDLPAALIGRAFPSLGDAAPDVGISLGGWISVLMIFVLARIFTAGAVMREEIEGTI
jgi:hypothetical protein